MSGPFLSGGCGGGNDGTGARNSGVGTGFFSRSEGTGVRCAGVAKRKTGDGDSVTRSTWLVVRCKGPMDRWQRIAALESHEEREGRGGACLGRRRATAFSRCKFRSLATRRGFLAPSWKDLDSPSRAKGREWVARRQKSGRKLLPFLGAVLRTTAGLSLVSLPSDLP